MRSRLAANCIVMADGSCICSAALFQELRVCVCVRSVSVRVCVCVRMHACVSTAESVLMPVVMTIPGTLGAPTLSVSTTTSYLSLP